MDEQDMVSEPTQKPPDKNKREVEEGSDKKKEPVAREYRNSQEGHDGDALAWLEGPAFNAPIEEMPTLQWPENNPENNKKSMETVAPNADQSLNEPKATHSKGGKPRDDLEEAMVWLEELAAGQGTPINEMPTLISGGQYDDITDEPAISQNLTEITGKTSILAEHDSDPMAWLEQLAVDQNSPLEELPSVADRLLASDIISQNDVEFVDETGLGRSEPMIVEVDEALNYLEKMAISEGIALDRISIDQLDIEDVPGNGLDTIDQLAAASPTIKVLTESDIDSTIEAPDGDWNELTTQIPDDPDEALAWLSGLSDEDSTDDGNQELLEGYKVDSVVDQGPTDTMLDVEALEEMPDDPDEAMAWMRGLADQEDDVSGAISNIDSDDILTGEESTASQIATGDDSLDFGQDDVARKAEPSGDFDKTIAAYRDMLESGEGGAALIAELETIVDEQPNSPDLIKLLGDAYMQDGQMQKALKTYRKGFDHL